MYRQQIILCCGVIIAIPIMVMASYAKWSVVNDANRCNVLRLNLTQYLHNEEGTSLSSHVSNLDIFAYPQLRTV